MAVDVVPDLDQAVLPALDGAWSSGAPADEFTVFEAATGREFATVQGGNAESIDRAVRTAVEAQRGWAALAPRDRGRLLVEVSRALAEHADDLAALETREMGKPFEQARRYDMSFCLDAFEFFGGLTDKLPGDFYDYGGPVNAYTFWEPYGVVAGVLPFNWPPIHTGAKSAPALAAGNAVVLKPPDQDPLTIMRIVEIANEILPPGVLQVVPGPGPETGAALVSHPGVSRLSFTGSTNTGRAVLKLAADNLIGALLELGGKNPFVVFEDADIDLAVRCALDGAFFNQGQACTAASRLIVHETVYDEFTEKLAAAVPRLRVGDGLDPSTHVGPLISRAQQARVNGYIDAGRQEGATVAAQADLPGDARLQDGFYVRPTLFTDVTPDMRIANEEIFGPVTAAIRFRDEAEALTIANATEYGLVAGVFTRDDGRAQRLLRGISAGLVMVNNYNRAFFGTPFGGTKASGYGREHAIDTMREFSRPKNVRITSGRAPVPVWSAALEIMPLRSDEGPIA